MFKVRQINEYILANGTVAVSRIICMGILAGLSAADVRCRKIPGLALILGSIMAVSYTILVGVSHIWLAVGGFLIGFLFVLLSRVTGEQLGYGDSWLLCVLGVYLGTWNMLLLLFAAWMSVALAAMATLAVCRFRRGMTLPMIPFITIGYIIMWADEIWL